MSSSPPPPPGGWEPPGGGWQPPSQTGPQDWGQPQQQQQWGAPPAAPPANGKATAALVLGIVGVACCPLVCSVLALIFGYQSRREIDQSQGRQSGRGNAVAGIVLGWIGIGLAVLGILYYVVAITQGWIDLDDTSSY